MPRWAPGPGVPAPPPPRPYRLLGAPDLQQPEDGRGPRALLVIGVHSRPGRLAGGGQRGPLRVRGRRCPSRDPESQQERERSQERRHRDPPPRSHREGSAGAGLALLGGGAEKVRWAPEGATTSRGLNLAGQSHVLRKPRSRFRFRAQRRLGSGCREMETERPSPLRPGLLGRERGCKQLGKERRSQEGAKR